MNGSFSRSSDSRFQDSLARTSVGAESCLGICARLWRGLRRAYSEVTRTIVYNGYGGPEMTTLAKRQESTPVDGEVLIRVSASALNPADAHRRDGALRSVARYAFPKVAGNEVSGIVADVGSASR